MLDIFRVGGLFAPFLGLWELLAPLKGFWGMLTHFSEFGVCKPPFGVKGLLALLEYMSCNPPF